MRLAATLALLAGGCSPDRVLTDDVGGDDEAPLTDLEPHTPRSLRVLQLATYDGSGQAVHPDFAQMGGWLNPFVLAATPYPNGAAGFENPSLFWREPSFGWVPVDWGANPVAKPTRGAYLSDPDIVATPGGELWVYYRQVTSDQNQIFLIKTRSGSKFTTPLEVVSAPNHMAVSPAVVRRDSTRWRMWSVNAGKDGCRAKSTTVELRRSPDGEHWSRPSPVKLSQGDQSVWHIDVQWIPSRKEYWALYNVKNGYGCATQRLYLATSPDGVAWQTYPSPVLAAGVIPEFADIVYRATFAYDPMSDMIRFWYSGARSTDRGIVWQMAFDRRERAEVFASISAPPNETARQLARPPVILLDPP